MKLESAGSQHSLIDHIDSISHSNNEDVVKLFDAVHFGQELIYDGLVYISARATRTPSLPTNGIDLIKDNYVQV